MTARTEQEAWEDEELVPDMTDNARRWFLAERARRKKGGDKDAPIEAAEGDPRVPDPAVDGWRGAARRL